MDSLKFVGGMGREINLKKLMLILLIPLAVAACFGAEVKDHLRSASPVGSSTGLPRILGVLQASEGQIPTVSSSFVSPAYVQTEHRLTVDGRDRTFVVQAPREPLGPLPVVFFFHGGGWNGLRTAALGFRDMVAIEQFIAVYPDAWKEHWNDGRNAPSIASQREGVDDVKFVRAMVEYLGTQYEIDRSRIFATGVSNGAIFCHYLAAHAADLIAGIAPIIGGMAEPVAATFKPSHPISLLVIQGDADPLVPIEGGPVGSSDRRGRVISTEEMLKKYLEHNGITGDPQVEQLPDLDPYDGTVTVVYRWPPGRDGVRVEYYLVKGGGHTVPGIEYGGVGNRSRDFNALEVVWNFFKKCPPRL